MVSGALALLGEAFPDLTPQQLRVRLLASADNSFAGFTRSGSVELAVGFSHDVSDEWGHDFLTRRSELASLRTKDMELQADGTVRALIRRSKADQLGFGRTVYGSTQSGDLLAEWLETREVETPWLFCPVRHGFAYDRPLSTSQVKNIIKAAAKAAGVEGDRSGAVSGHSLRVGAAQELMARGADIGTIMRAGGWKTVDVVARYVQKTEVNVWLDR